MCLTSICLSRFSQLLAIRRAVNTASSVRADVSPGPETTVTLAAPTSSSKSKLRQVNNLDDSTIYPFTSSTTTASDKNRSRDSVFTDSTDRDHDLIESSEVMVSFPYDVLLFALHQTISRWVRDLSSHPPQNTQMVRHLISLKFDCLWFE